MLFCASPTPPKLIQMTWTKINQRNLMIDAIKNVDSTYVNSCVIQSKSAAERVENVDIDVKMTVEAIAGVVERV